MPRTLRISEDTARALQTLLEMAGVRTGEHIAALRAALARLNGVPKPQKRRPRLDALARGTLVLERLHRADRKAQKTARRQDIRTAVFLRATDSLGATQCEGPYNSDPLQAGRCVLPATELQHVFGRGKGRMPESERNCLAACHSCHVAETHNQPSGVAWWTYFARFFEAKGFHYEAGEALKRARTAEVKANLPAAPRVR